MEEIIPEDNLVFELADLFKVFGDSTRIKILFTMLNKEVCVTDICNIVGMSPSAVSHQLKILRQNDLVKPRKDGKEVYYTLADDHVKEIFSVAIEHAKEMM